MEAKRQQKREFLGTVNAYKYLRLTLKTTGQVVQTNKSKAAAAILNKKLITRLSLETAMVLFNANIVPMAVYME